MEQATAQKVLNQPMPLFGSDLLASYQAGVAPLAAIWSMRTVLDTALAALQGQSGAGAGGNYTANQIVSQMNTALAPYTTTNGGYLTPNPVSYNATTDEFSFNANAVFTPYQQTLTKTQGLGLNGLLTMSTAGQASVAVNYGINFDFGLDSEFFIRTNGQGPEIQLGLVVAQGADPNNPNPNLSVGGDIALGGFQLFTASVLSTSGLNAQFAVNLTDADGKLRLGELTTNYSFAQVNATGALNLGVALDTPNTLLGLIDLHTELSVNWNFAADNSGFYGTAPTITLANSRIDVLSFLDNGLKPFLDKVRTVLDPVSKVMAVLKDDIEFLSNLPGVEPIFDVVDENEEFRIESPLNGGDGKVTLLDLFALKAPVEYESVRQFIATADAVATWYNFLNAPLTFSERLAIGNFSITSDIRDGTFSTAMLGGAVQSGQQGLEEFIAGQDLGADAATLRKILGVAQGGQPPTGLATSVSAPLLTDGQTALGYLFGQNLDIIKFDLPKLAVAIGGQVDDQGEFVGDLLNLFQFPVFGVPVTIEGGLRAIADIDFGYDTRGLQHYIQSGTLANGNTLDPSKLLDGIYVTDWGSNGQERPELVLGAQLNFVMGGGISGLLDFYAGGALEGIINLDIVDGGVVDDGRVHYDEFIAPLSQPLKLFEGQGLITASLIAYVEFLWWTKQFKSPSIVLGEFNFGGETGDPFNPGLASVDGNGDLILHIGFNAPSRLIADKLDNSETFSIVPLSSGDRFTVTALGYTQTFDNVPKIYALAGLLDDTINVGPTLSSAVDITGDAGDDILSGGAGNDSILGDDAADTAAGRDFLAGEGGNDTLRGGGGNDFLDGGTGADSLIGGDGTDLVTYINSAAAVNIVMNRFVQTGGDAQGDQLFSIENIVGSDVDGQGDYIEDNNSIGFIANIFSGLRGNDLLIGGIGDDTLIGGEGNDTLDGGGDDDLLSGGGGDDIYGIDSLGDSINENLYDPGSGIDLVVSVINLGLGNWSDIEQLRLRGPARIGDGNGLDNWIKGTGFEAEETVPGDYNDILRGLAGADTLLGGRGGDQLEGGAGNDSLEGGADDDLLLGGGDIDNLLGGEGDDTLDGGAGNDTLEGGADDDLLLGGDDVDDLLGGQGNDTLEGGSGADSLRGGAGDDLIRVETASDQVFEAVSEGDDTVAASVDFVLTAGAEVELLQTSDAGGVTTRQLRGNAFAQMLVGDLGDNVLEGMEGADTLFGGSGYDIASYEHASAAITLDVLTGEQTGDAAGDVIMFLTIDQVRGTDGFGDTLAGASGSDAFNGLGGADLIDGREGGDILFGGLGNDTLIGGLGDDTLAGGAGDDVYFVDSQGDTVDDDRAAHLNGGGGGRDLIITGLNYSLGAAADRADIEDLWLVAGEARQGTGNAIANQIVGTAFNDTIDGGGSGDDLRGGQGNDLYFFDSTGDRVVEQANEGTDEIRIATAGFYNLGPPPGFAQTLFTFDMTASWLVDVENALLTDNVRRVDIVGNGRNNLLVGNTHGSVINSGLGDDTVDAGSGTDTVDMGGGSDTLRLSWSNYSVYDTGTHLWGGTLEAGYSGAFAYRYNVNDGGGDHRVFFSGVERFDIALGARNDYLRTGDGDDTVRGGAGNDDIDSGKGVDVIDGEAGSADRWTGDKSFMIAGQAMNLNLNAADVQATYLGGTTVRGIEALGFDVNNRFRTGAAGDTIVTHTSNQGDYIATREGDDAVTVYFGTDHVDLGEGNDLLIVDWSAYTTYDTGTHLWAGTLATGYSGAYAYRANVNDSGGDHRVFFSGVERFDIALGNKNDYLRTGDGDDTVRGGAGSDHLVTQLGEDSIDGEAGDDRWEADKAALTVAQPFVLNLRDTANAATYGTRGSVTGIEMLTLVTGAGADDITTLRALHADQVTTNDGDDTVTTGGGTDTIAMGTGNDLLIVDWSAYTAYDTGTHQWDGTLAAGYSGAYAYRANVNDSGGDHRVFFSGVERFDIALGLKNDYLRTGDGDDTVKGGAGDDYLVTQLGEDSIDGEAGDDRWEADKAALTAAQPFILNLRDTANAATYGARGSVTGIETLTLVTGAGADNITTLRALHADQVTTNAGDDTVTTGGGTDTIAMGTGNDLLIVDWSAYTAYDTGTHLWDGTLAGGYTGAYAYRTNVNDGGGNHRVFFSGVERFDIALGARNDYLRTGDGDDTVRGGAGNDDIDSGKGVDVIDGEAGLVDRWTGDKSFMTAGQAMNLNLNVADVQATYLGGATVRGIEALGFDVNNRFRTGAAGDTIVTHTSNQGDYIATGAGDDAATVYFGTDHVDLGEGNDLLIVDWSAYTTYDTGTHQWGGTLAGGYSGVFAYRPNFNDPAGDHRVFFSGVERFDVSLGTKNDLLRTGDGDDTVRGGAGSDHLLTQLGEDSIDGGEGDDRWEADKAALTAAQPFILNLRDTANAATYGARGSVTGIEMLTLVTGAGADNVTTLRALHADQVTTNAGDDTVTTGGGTDTIAMGTGNDLLIVDWSAYTTYDTGTHLWDGTLAGGYTGAYAYRTNVNDASGDHRVFFSGVERFDIALGARNDYLRTGDGDDTVRGGAGNDDIDSGKGVDVIDGEAGLVDRWTGDKSFMTAGQAMNLNLNVADVQATYLGGATVRGIEALGFDVNNRFRTGAAGDTIVTHTSNQGDYIATGAGNDAATVYFGTDHVDLGEGNDLLIVDWSDYGVYDTGTHQWSGTLATGYSGAFAYRYNVNDGGGDHRVFFAGVERFDIALGVRNDFLRTGDGEDTVRGGAGNDLISTMGGNDLLVGGAGNDTLEGGDGLDIADWSDATGDVTFTLAANGAGTFANAATGTDTFTSIEGVRLGSGNDQLVGNSLDNLLVGGAGNDTLTGGGGADSFILARSALVDGANDVVTDFSAAQGDILVVKGGTLAEMALAGSGLVRSFSMGAATNALTMTAAGNLRVDWYATEGAATLANGATRTYDAGGFGEWALYTDHYDSQNRFDYQTGVYDGSWRAGGSWSLDSDQANDQSFVFYRNEYNTAGALYQQFGRMDDGRSWEYVFNGSGIVIQQTWTDTSGTRDWASYTSYHTSTGAYDYEVGTYDSGWRAGGSWSTDIDQAGDQYFQYYRNEYNSAGVAYQQFGLTDDGRGWETNFANGLTAQQTWSDVSSTREWSGYIDFYDASGRLDYEIGTYDSGWRAGGTWSYDIDQNNDNAFITWYRNEFNAVGVLYQQFAYTDDGRALEALFANGLTAQQKWTDANGSREWSSYTDFYAASGALDYEIGAYDSGWRAGGTWSYDADQDGNQFFQWYRNEYNGAGQLYQQFGYTDDGRVWEFVIAADGALTSQKWTDVAANQSWTTYTDTLGNYGNGLTIHRTGVNDNGSAINEFF